MVSGDDGIILGKLDRPMRLVSAGERMGGGRVGQVEVGHVEGIAGCVARLVLGSATHRLQPGGGQLGGRGGRRGGQMWRLTLDVQSVVHSALRSLALEFRQSMQSTRKLHIARALKCHPNKYT